MVKVADFVIRYLADVGIRHMFVVYGAANGDLIDAFTRMTQTQYIAVMHEQAGGFAAEGYAKISGKPGVAIATSGPGGMNLLTAMGNCFYDSVPCLFLTGQVNTRFLRPDPSVRQVGFQETDIVGMATPVTKYAKLVRSPEDIRYELEKALWICQTGRPGPVLLDLPIDVQKALVDEEALVGFTPISSELSFDTETMKAQIRSVVDKLVQAQRPVLLVGGGVRLSGAQDDIRELGRVLRIPCFPTWNALDVITSDYEWYGGRVGTYGGAGRNFGVQNSDWLLAIGSRISGRITGGNPKSFARKATKILVDIDPGVVQQKFQQVPFDLNIHCDAKIFIRELLAYLRTYTKRAALPDWTGWVSQVMDWKQRYDPVRPEFFHEQEYVHPYAFMRCLSECMGPNDVLVGDCGGNIVVSNHSFETKFGQRLLTNNGNSPMGFSFAGAIGAWLADPKRRVVCTIGDGGFNMNLQELQTLVNYKIGIKTFILNNHIYGITKAFQETNFQGRAEACGPKGYTPPDFIKIVEAYGIKAISLDRQEHMVDTIHMVLNHEGPIVCDVNMHEFHTYEPRIFGWETPIEDMYPYLPREEFRQNMLIEPWDQWLNPPYPDIVRSPQGDKVLLSR